MKLVFVFTNGNDLTVEDSDANWDEVIQSITTSKWVNAGGEALINLENVCYIKVMDE